MLNFLIGLTIGAGFGFALIALVSARRETEIVYSVIRKNADGTMTHIANCINMEHASTVIKQDAINVGEGKVYLIEKVEVD